MRTANGMSEEYPREPPFAAVMGFWVATLVASWILVGLAIVAIWQLVT